MFLSVFYQFITSISTLTTLINIGGGTLHIELFRLKDKQVSFLKQCSVKKGQAISLKSPDIAYRIHPDSQVVVAKLHEDSHFDCVHYFNPDGIYQCSIPVGFTIYHTFYALCVASSFNQLDDILMRYKDVLLAGPVPFLWETAKFLIRYKNKSCYLFLDEIIARNDKNFSAAAQQTKINAQEVL